MKEKGGGEERGEDSSGGTRGALGAIDPPNAEVSPPPPISPKMNDTLYI